MYAMGCANCGMSPESAGKIITGGCLYEDEGEWVCSDSCYSIYSEKGCPLEEGGHYRRKEIKEGLEEGFREYDNKHRILS